MSSKDKVITKAPTKPDLKDANKELRNGHPSGARAVADESVAVLQGVVKKGKNRRNT